MLDDSENCRLLLVDKKTITQWMREPYLIPNQQLCSHVSMCLANDTQYGPIAMALHANIGSEYERHLIEEIKKHRLHYEGDLSLLVLYDVVI